ncbi:MAG: hypothetical protein NW206_06310 [Hyphomonadaceae bacterium]|nr:hypothetical protein [Hyphomonadaceae bacterium]
MMAGYDFSCYSELCTARARLLPGKTLGLPFVSVAGPQYEVAPTRVLYVGKSPWATHDEGACTGTPEEYEAGLAWSADWLEQQSTPSSAFWRFAAKVVHTLMPGLPGPAMSYMAWSDLAKVAQYKRGAPDRTVAAVMHAAECAALRQELATFEPDLVVLVSNDAVWNVATTIFGDRPDMIVHDDQTWCRPEAEGRNFKLYWTRHPQGAPLKWHSRHAARIAEFVNA